MSKEVDFTKEYQMAGFGDYGFRVLTGASAVGERFSSVMALSDSTVTVTSTRNGDATATIDIATGVLIYGDLAITALTGKVIGYLREV